jgi:HEAT repeat protein
MRSRRSALILAILTVVAASAMRAQESGPQALSAQAIRSSIDAMGDLDFPVRMNAARALRRAPGESVVPALIQAVVGHKDPFVRFRALVLLTGFDDSRTSELVREIVGNPNDRLRAVAYMYYEHHPAEDVLPVLLQSLEREESEFVRPALIRALAARGHDPRVRETLLVEVDRGQDFFRSGVIDALGDYRASYAVQPLIAAARTGGPLQVDAVVALGKLKDPGAMEALASLQQSAPREIQPTCGGDLFARYQLRRPPPVCGRDTSIGRNRLPGTTAQHGDGACGAGKCRPSAGARALFEVGSVGRRQADALGVGTVAIPNTSLLSCIRAC